MKRIELYRIYWIENEKTEALDIYFKTEIEARRFCNSAKTMEWAERNKGTFKYKKENIDIYKNVQKYWQEHTNASIGFEH